MPGGSLRARPASPAACPELSRMFSGVSPGWMMRAEIPSAQAEAETSSAWDFTSWWVQSPVASLSSISRSAVAASGTRSSASASTIRASPSRVESEYSRRKSSIPPSPPDFARIASTSRVARASMRASAAAARGACANKPAAISFVGSRIGGGEHRQAFGGCGFLYGVRAHRGPVRTRCHSIPRTRPPLAPRRAARGCGTLPRFCASFTLYAAPACTLGRHVLC